MLTESTVCHLDYRVSLSWLRRHAYINVTYSNTRLYSQRDVLPGRLCYRYFVNVCYLNIVPLKISIYWKSIQSYFCPCLQGQDFFNSPHPCSPSLSHWSPILILRKWSIGPYTVHKNLPTLKISEIIDEQSYLSVLFKYAVKKKAFSRDILFDRERQTLSQDGQ